MSTSTFPTPPRPGPPAGPTHPPLPPQPPQGGGAPPPPHGPRPTAEPRRSRLPSSAEALGWGGGLVTTVGVVATTADFWSTLRGWPLLGVLAIATAVLAGGAMTVASLDRDDDDTLARQLATALFLMAGMCTTWTAYVAADLASGGRPYLAVLAASAAATGMSGAAARRSDADRWRALTLLSTTVMVFAGTALATEDTVVRSAGVALTGAAALCAAVTWRPDATRVSQWLALTLTVGGAEAALVLGPQDWAAGLIAVGMAAVAGVTLVRARPGLGWTAAAAASAIALQVLGEVVPGLFTLSTALLAAGVTMVLACIAVIRRQAG